MSIGAAGTFVIREKVSQTQLRDEFARKLPFDAEIVICDGREIARLITENPFADRRPRAGIVRFVSVLAKRPRATPLLPMVLPVNGKWRLKILARENRFVFGFYRRHMKVIGYLGTLDRIFGAPATTRNWNTITEIARVLST